MDFFKKNKIGVIDWLRNIPDLKHLGPYKEQTEGEGDHFNPPNEEGNSKPREVRACAGAQGREDYVNLANIFVKILTTFFDTIFMHLGLIFRRNIYKKHVDPWYM